MSLSRAQKNRLIYSGLLICCIIGFWWFENFYTPDPYPSEPGETHTDFPAAFLPDYPGGELIRHDHFLLGYSEPHEQAAWVAYSLLPAHLTYEDRERPYFVEDPKVTTKSADWRNYRGSGYDRGHLCPAGDRRYSESAYNQTFYTSNISPQDPEFNAGIWNDLELQVRRGCKRYGPLYVITGGVLEDGLEGIGDEDVRVPRSFYKVVIRGSGKDLRVMGFLMPNRPGRDRISEYSVPLDRIEALTGLDFFPGLSTEEQARLESTLEQDHWRF